MKYRVIEFNHAYECGWIFVTNEVGLYAAAKIACQKMMQTGLLHVIMPIF